MIAPEFDVHDALTIDPGLIAASIDYGYMRAADVLLGLSDEHAALSAEIARTRMRHPGRARAGPGVRRAAGGAALARRGRRGPRPGDGPRCASSSRPAGPRVRRCRPATARRSDGRPRRSAGAAEQPTRTRARLLDPAPS